VTTAGGEGTKRWDAFMVFFALASLVPVAWVELRDLTWADPLFRKLAIVDLTFVGLFAGEFCVRFARAPDRPRFMRDNWYDLLGLVPLYAESLAWLRAARFLRILRVLRAFRGVRFVGRVYRDSHLGATFTIASGVMISIATLFYFAESGKNPAVQSWGDALWWAMTTTATVGYGDIVPRTTTGRALAAVLMVTGIGLFGVIASTLSSAIMRVRGADDAEEAMRALLRQHRDLVVRHSRGELSEDELERATADLLKIRGR
jgi:voltage-gated potassium channel